MFKRLLKPAALALLLCFAAAKAAVVVVGFGGTFGAVQFVENATQDFDYGLHTSLPNGFGDGEFTLKVVIEPSQVSTIGQTSSGSGIIQNWANETAEPGDSSDWWYYGNFLLDGHNNSAPDDGTFSIQIYNSGVVRWTFGDGDASVPLGGLWGVQDSSGTNVLDGSRHVLHLVRSWQSSPANSADLELWVDDVLQDTVNTGSRTDMAATYWDSWTGFPVGQQGWMWGAEKVAALGGADWADYKGLVNEITFYGDALSASEIAADQGVVDTGHVDYLDHWPLDEGVGTSADSANGISMSLNNPGDFWP